MAKAKAKAKAKPKGMMQIDIPEPAPLMTPGGHVIVPGSGEMFRPVEVDHVTLGEYLRRLRDLEDQIKVAKRAVMTEVLARMDHKASWTMQFGPGKMTAPSPTNEPDYVGDRLHANLEQLVADGVIGEEAALAACKEDLKWKPMKGGIKKLKALGDEKVEQALELASEPNEKPRTVRIELDPSQVR
jgi:hypothetical protein